MRKKKSRGSSLHIFIFLLFNISKFLITRPKIIFFRYYKDHKAHFLFGRYTKHTRDCMDFHKS